MKLVTTILKNIDKLSTVFKILKVASKTFDSFKEHYIAEFPDQKELLESNLK